jgi:hypothetical protein
MQQPKRKKPYLGLIIIVSTLTILMFILLAAIGAVILSGQYGGGSSVSSLLTGRTPLNYINTAEIDPALALASLGGVAESEVIIEAIRKGRAETALAALVYQPTLTDKETTGDFLLLSGAYETQGNREKAVFSNQMAGLIATLSPNLPDTARGDLFLQAGENLKSLEEPEWAKFFLNQAMVVAAKSPFLQAAHRRMVLERLQQDYLGLGERELARQSLDIMADPPPSSLNLEAQPVILPQTAEPIALTQSIQEAEARRWEKAQELAALLVERGGKAPPDAITALKEALLAEDAEKLPFYDSELETATQISRKIDITLAKIEWLSIKYRLARRAFGLSIVPEWEAETEQIRADLTKTYETLFSLYADLIVALPQVSQIDKATEERLRREVLAGELGRYPNYPEEQRRKQLLDAVNQLIATQPELKVFVGVGQVAGRELYRLMSPEQ